MTACHLPPRGLRGVYRDDPDARAIYSEAAGIGRIVPAAVCVPADADDVVTIIHWASERSLSIVPRGSGTSMGGGAIGSGVIVDLSRMNAISDVNIESRSVRVGPGALRGDVNRAASRHGLRFPVDPSSGDYCTVGGMVSTNAAGARTLRFGATRSWVLALDCVFDDGTMATIVRGEQPPAGVPAIERFISQARDQILGAARSELRHSGVCKDSSGYGLHSYATSGELVDLLAGSEGTLAVVVGVKLALADLPGATTGVLATFASLDDAVAAAAHARATRASACELLDRTFLDVARGGRDASDASDASNPDAPMPNRVTALDDIPEGTEAVLLSEIEGDTREMAAKAARDLASTFTAAGATSIHVAIGADEQHEIWELRHAASPILSQLDPALKSMQFIEDGAVPPQNLAAYVRGVRKALDARNVRGVIFGHAGDAHMHVNPLIDTSRANWREDVTGLLRDVVALTASLGGTLAGEHGDGRIRTPLLATMWPPEAVRLFTLVKSAFDPRGLLNPGVKVPLAGQQPLGDIKYDPALPPLPPAARAALDLVSSERAYARLRLSLLGESD